MTHHEIDIRRATADDVGLVAWTVLEALDLDTDDTARAMVSCSDLHSMYSWTNAYVATVDGEPAGCLVAYDGARYMDMRRYTWPSLWTDFDTGTLEGMDIETVAGEFYLDSMAVKKQYRGLGIGRKLIMYAIADASGVSGVPTLIVSVDKPRLAEYYASMGFVPNGTVNFLGNEFVRMQQLSLQR